MKFLIYSKYGEILDLAVHLQNEGHEVLFYVPEQDYKKIGDGIVEKAENWFDYLGKGYIWVVDTTELGKFQDWLRKKGELVFGGCEAGDKLENDRQANQKWFKAAGFNQPESQNFKDFDEAIDFLSKNADKKWILKQNGDAPKSINYMGKFDGNIDLIYHLEYLKKSWNVSEYGEIDFDLMEIVKGLEVAASAFFNGKEFLKNKDGKVVGFLNFEEKKECDGDSGETTGEMGTTFIGVTEDNNLFKEILLKPQIIKVLKEIKFQGVFDINCIQTEDGLVALEPTMRMGIPASSYELTEGMKNTGEMIDAVARGISKPIEIQDGFGMVMCVVAKPFPVELDIDDEGTSMNERLWVLRSGQPVDDFDEEQSKHIHLYNFEKKDDAYKVVSKCGYLMTVTGTGKTVSTIRTSLIDYIKNNIYIQGMKYRTDIGNRLEKSDKSNLYYDEKLKELESKHRKEIEDIKGTIKNILNEE